MTDLMIIATFLVLLFGSTGFIEESIYDRIKYRAAERICLAAAKEFEESFDLKKGFWGALVQDLIGIKDKKKKKKRMF